MDPVGRVRSTILRHAVIRRVITIPALLLLAALTAVVVPVIALFTAPVTAWGGGSARAARFGTFLAVYLGTEIEGLLSAAGLRMRGHRNRSTAGNQDANYRLLARLLDRLYRAASRFYGLRVLLAEADPGFSSGQPQMADLPAGPLILLSRHGGPGGSFLLVHLLVVRLHRRPRIVLKNTLALDPLIDVLLHRLPHCFIDPDPDPGESAAARVGRLADGMRAGDALVLFPEGGNFTPGRRIRAIARLRRRGLRESAKRAQQLQHVLPPRPAGVFAAIDAARDASVVFVAHTGLDHFESAAAVWRSIPLSEPVKIAWWTVSPARVPTDPAERLRWLHDNWAAVDAWIDRHRTTPASE